MKQTKFNRRHMPYLRILLIAIISITFYVFLNNLGSAKSFLENVLSVFTPITIGLCLAFVFNIPLRFLELKIFGKLTKKNGKIWSKLKRPLCLILSVLLILLLFALFTLTIIPRAEEIGKSLLSIVSKLPQYIQTAVAWIDELSAKLDVDLSRISAAIAKINGASISEWIFDKIQLNSTNIAEGAFNTVVGAFTGITNAVLGFALAMYILASKEALGKLFKSMVYAIFSKERAKNIISLFQLSNKAFTGFVSGQCLEVITIGVLCFIGMLIFRFPEPLLVSSIIAVTAFIPVFGPFIGTAIGAVIILIINGSLAKALLFVVYIIVLQQIESNVIYPRIMGGQVGLPGIWVLIAVTLGGGFFGIAGIILSVPICSVLYTLLDRWLLKRLKEKNICHHSMTADATEPKHLIDEIGDYDLPPDEEIRSSAEIINEQLKKAKEEKKKEKKKKKLEHSSEDDVHSADSASVDTEEAADDNETESEE